MFTLLWMAVDKSLACCGDDGAFTRDYTRVPEPLLLLPVLLGGTIGFLAGMVVCCHKVSKFRFKVQALCCGLVARLVHPVVLGVLVGTS